MTSRSLNTFCTLIVTASCALLAGCQSPSPSLRLGERAERQGRYHLAYQHYCDAAKRYPSDGMVQAAISRVSPRAALHYERHAAQAVETENYADAWRLYMQALTITPDDSAVAGMIKMLEQHHPQEVAPAKAAWRRHGEAALAVRSPGRGWRPPPRTTPVQPAEESYRVAELPGVEPERKAASDPGPILDPHQEASSAMGQAQEGARDGRNLIASTESPAAPEAPVEQVRSDDSTAQDGGGRARSEGSAEDPDYLMTAIISVEDRRFPRRTHTFDDIHVRLKDTDSDPDADLDIYMGTQRVGKARDIEPGQGVRVRGRSGKHYEVVVITIVDRTESVRIGIRPNPVIRR